jgi:L-lactate utilization protein LutB
LPLSSKGSAIISIFIFIISNLQDNTKESFLKGINEIRQSFIDSLIFTFLTNPQKGDIKRYFMTDAVKNEAKELIQDFFSEKEIEFIFKNKSIVIEFLKKLSQKYIV